MDKCPNCGSTLGVYKTYTGVQYYDFDGNDAGYYADVPENQKTFARCIKCQKKISLDRIKREAQNDDFRCSGERKDNVH